MEARKVRFASTGRRVVAVNDDGSPMGVYPPLSELELEHMGAEGKQVPRTGSAGVGLSRPEAPIFPAGPYTIPCPSCSGSGENATYADSRARGDRCRACQGAGWLRVEWCPQPDGSLTFIQHGPGMHPDQAELGL